MYVWHDMCMSMFQCLQVWMCCLLRMNDSLFGVPSVHIDFMHTGICFTNTERWRICWWKHTRRTHGITINSRRPEANKCGRNGWNVVWGTCVHSSSSFCNVVSYSIVLLIYDMMSIFQFYEPPIRTLFISIITRLQPYIYTHPTHTHTHIYILTGPFSHRTQWLSEIRGPMG